MPLKIVIVKKKTFAICKTKIKHPSNNIFCGLIETSTNHSGWINYTRNSTLLRHLRVVSDSAQRNERAGEH